MNLLGVTFLYAADASDVATKAAESAPASTGSAWMTLLVVLAVLGLPFVIGQAVANVLKLKDLGFRIGLSLFTLVLGASPFVAQMTAGHSWTNAFKFGIDLAGGTNMVFQVDEAGVKAAGTKIDRETMEKMVNSVRRRIVVSGTEEITVRKVGSESIEVIVPGADKEETERVKRQITRLGNLEFAILANSKEHADIIALGQQAKLDVREIYRKKSVPKTIIKEDGSKVEVEGEEEAQEVLVAKWRAVATNPRTKEQKEVGSGDFVASREVIRDGKTIREFLVVVEPNPDRRVTGKYLVKASPGSDENGPVVSFRFNTRGGYLFRQLTSKYQPRDGAGYRSRLAILLNDEIHSAPTINAVIGEQGQISGQFDQKELTELINVLNAGALEVPLKEQPVSEFSISPLLGTDVQDRGFFAMKISILAVFVVTAGYYLFSGLVADFCLICNVILLGGIMAMINATFTLPGLAGFVLSIGMAVDTNVLIFERMREERAKGSSLRMCIKNGFDKAWTTIIDSNMTTLISAMVLYIIGTDQVKGFAVTLFIGILVSLFTAIYIGRLIFDIFERKRWITELKMNCLVAGNNYDFVGKTKLFITLSALAIIGGMALVGYRGNNGLDIDFRGGSMVTFRFIGDAGKETTVEAAQKDNELVQKALTDEAPKQGIDPSITVEQLKVPSAGGQRIYYRMRTTETDQKKVAKLVNIAFADKELKLVRQVVTNGEATEITEESLKDSDHKDFAKGHDVEVTLSEPFSASSLNDEVIQALKQAKVEVESPVLTTVVKGEAKKFDVKFKPAVTTEAIQKALEAVKGKLESEPSFDEVNSFESEVADSTKVDGIAALLLSCLGIILYLWVRFQGVTFGFAAVIAMFHDVLIVVGALALGALLQGNPISSLFGLVDFKVNLTVIAALLTIIGYSVNDTIVVFDRIREVRGKNPKITWEMVNQSLNFTLSRTLLTSVTTLIVCVILYYLGGEGLHGFAFCLIIGIITGTFSSLYVASPVLVWLMNRHTPTSPSDKKNKLNNEMVASR